MIVTKRALDRRTVLRGLGATLALPLLDSMVPALTAQSRTAARRVNRLGVVYVPNGIRMDHWTPKVDGSDFELTTRRSASRYCSARSRMPSTRLKMAVLAPMPSSSVNTAIALTNGLRRSCRTPNRISCISVDHTSLRLTICSL